MSARFSKIEEDVLADHFHLTQDDECYFLLEYTSNRGYSFGKANSFINNLKKPTEFRSRPEVWRHKVRAVNISARWLGEAINHEWLKSATLVPVPPSKAKNDPKYDDRMVRILQTINPGFQVDVRELVIQSQTLRASHLSGESRVTVEELLAAYEIDESLANPAPVAIGIVDDVLTAGTHYNAMKTVLKDRFLGVPVVGFFIARRVFPPEEENSTGSK